MKSRTLRIYFPKHDNWMHDRREQRRRTETLLSNLDDPKSRAIVRRFEDAMWAICNAMDARDRS